MGYLWCVHVSVVCVCVCCMCLCRCGMMHASAHSSNSHSQQISVTNLLSWLEGSSSSPIKAYQVSPCAHAQVHVDIHLHIHTCGSISCYWHMDTVYP